MESRALAGQTLFAPTPEEKLRCLQSMADVYVFNPFAEGFIAQGKAFAPGKYQTQLANDLTNLPQFLCRQNDVVLLPRLPSVEFVSGIKQAGFALPEFVEFGGIPALAQRKLGALRPWAWGPDSAELLAPLFPSVTGEERTADQRFHESIASLYSKAWSAQFLRNILAEWRRDDGANSSNTTDRSPSTPAATDAWLCTEEEVGVTATTLEAALEAIATIRRRGHHKIVIKQALGVAGQNAIRLWEPDLLDSHRRWLAKAVQGGRQVVIEPWLERELDFSVQFEMGPQGLKLCGYTGLINDLKGQFLGNWAEPHHHQRIPTRVLSLFREPAGIADRLDLLYRHILARLEAELQHAGHVGPVGLDALVYRTPQGACRIKPVVEMNPRYTMGRLTVELMKQTCPGSCGLFRLVSRAQVQREGFTDFAGLARSLSERFPLRLEPVSKIREGALCLNDPSQAQACLAVFRVGRTLDALLNPS